MDNAPKTEAILAARPRSAPVFIVTETVKIDKITETMYNTMSPEATSYLYRTRLPAPHMASGGVPCLTGACGERQATTT